MPARSPIRRFPASPFLPAAILFALVMILRACFSGISYEPILDDSIQYVSYGNADPFLLIAEEGLFSSRPLAAIVDLFLLAPMRDCLILPVLVISALHGVAAAIFARLFEKYFHTGAIFPVVYALLPLGVEGTFWLSASSRIAVGLFFTALTAYFFDRFLESGCIRHAVGFILFEALAFFLYEQVLVVAFTLTVLLFFRHRGNKRAYLAFASLVTLAAYAVFTAANRAEGALAARMEILLPTTRYWWDTFLPNLLGQMWDVFFRGGFRTLFAGCIRGVRLAVSDGGGILFLTLALLASAGWFFLTKPRSGRNVVALSGSGGALIWGILLTVAPVTPFFLIANPYFPMRAAVCSFIGLGLLVDLLLRGMFRSGRIFRAISAVLLFVFLLAGGSEVHDYKKAAAVDTAIAEEILAHEAEMSGVVGIFGVQAYPVPEQNFPYQEHVISAAAAEWSLFGKITAVKGENPAVTVVPLTADGTELYRDWNRDAKRLTRFSQIWLWENGALSPLAAEQVGEYDFDLYRMDGSLYARVRETDGIGRIE